MHTPFWKRLTLLACLALLPACGDETPTAGAQEPARDTASSLAAPAANKFRKFPDAVPGQYIVVLKDDALGNAKVPEVAEAHARPHGASVTQTYSHALRGYVVRTHEAAARAIAARPEVDYVVEDVRASPTATQSSAPWNLDRIDQINWTPVPRSGEYVYSATGAGVHVYVIDSGIKTNHPDFGGRATGDYTAIQDGRGAEDCTGHGTHVAGTVGGTQWGVAKGVRLHAVRVSGCAGDANNVASSIIKGVDWVTANHIKPAVANMSVGVQYVAFEPLDTAVRNSIKAGVVYVVAAGNENIDACTRSPARVAEAITVGATADNDSRLSDSNYGTCVDLFAPGLFISSAALDGTSTYMSGTSMASPHVAGVAALYLASNPSAAPATVRTAVVYNSPDNKVTSAGSGSPTRMLHSTPLTTCGRLSSGEALNAGRTLPACAGQGRLIHQTDGNVVIYDRLGALWNTGTWSTTTSSFIMQTDGNLVLYTGTGGVLWSVWGGGNAGAYLRLHDNCNLVMYSASGAQLWATNTTCR
jgi:subtilisin family serine protease